MSDDDDVVRAAVSGRLTDLDLADDMLATAERDFDACADALGLWASSDKFIQVVEDEHGHAVRRLREMLRDKASIKRVAENADTLVDDLKVCGPSRSPNNSGRSTKPKPTSAAR